MPAVVVDTCVVSYLLKGDTRAEQYRSHLEGNTLVISFMTLAELHRWALERNWGERRRTEMAAYLRSYTIYPFNHALCVQWATTKDQAQRSGRGIKTDDAWIAATALLYDIPVITNNRSDFEVLEPDLKVVSES